MRSNEQKKLKVGEKRKANKAKSTLHHNHLIYLSIPSHPCKISWLLLCLYIFCTAFCSLNFQSLSFWGISTNYTFFRLFSSQLIHFFFFLYGCVMWSSFNTLHDHLPLYSIQIHWIPIQFWSHFLILPYILLNYAIHKLSIYLCFSWHIQRLQNRQKHVLIHNHFHLFWQKSFHGNTLHTSHYLYFHPLCYISVSDIGKYSGNSIVHTRQWNYYWYHSENSFLIKIMSNMKINYTGLHNSPHSYIRKAPLTTN